MATAELAMALPVLLVCAGAAFALVSVAGTHMRAQDVAREAARFLARGDQVNARRVVAQALPGARLQVIDQGDTLRIVVATVVHPISSSLPGIALSAEAVAAREPRPE